MLILKNSDVKYCKVSHFKNNKTKTLLGLNYRGLLFVKSRSYTKSQLSSAIARCRYFLDLENPIASIVLQEENKISVWFEHRKVKMVKMLESHSSAPLRGSLRDRRLTNTVVRSSSNLIAK